MYKSSFFIFILRFGDWLNERGKELYIVLMTVVIALALGFGINTYLRYSYDPMFINPNTVLEHFAQPIFISMFSTVVILVFGIFVTNLMTMVPFRRIQLFRLEMEFYSQDKRDKEIENQFLYTSTMLQNHTENVLYLLENDFTELEEVLRFITESYKETALHYNDDLVLEIEVVSPVDINEKQVLKLYKTINRKFFVSTNTVYVNRILKGHNLLVGVISLEEIGEVVMIVRRDYANPFDTFDQETFESILSYASILFDTVTMISLFVTESDSDNI